MSKRLEKLTLKNGQFFNEAGKKVKVEVVDLDMALVDTAEPLFQGHGIPEEADAFAQGTAFDENRGNWGNFPRYVAPTVYLRKVAD